MFMGAQAQARLRLISEWPSLGSHAQACAWVPWGFLIPMTQQSGVKAASCLPLEPGLGGVQPTPAAGRSSYCQGFSRQYNTNQRDLNVRQAWEQGYTGKGIVVSILDDGIEKNHPDLESNYVSVG